MQFTTQHRFQAFTARMLTKTFGFCGNPLQLWWRGMGALWSHYSAELKFKIQPYSLSGGLLRGVTDPRSLWRIALIPIGPYNDFIFFGEALLVSGGLELVQEDLGLQVIYWVEVWKFEYDDLTTKFLVLWFNGHKLHGYFTLLEIAIVYAITQIT